VIENCRKKKRRVIGFLERREREREREVFSRKLGFVAI
jgi:hypothetical protein